MDNRRIALMDLMSTPKATAPLSNNDFTNSSGSPVRSRVDSSRSSFLIRVCRLLTSRSADPGRRETYFHGPQLLRTFSLKGTNMHAVPRYLAAIAACTIAIGVTVQSVKPVRASSPRDAVAGDKASPIYGVTMPPGYRQWEVVAPSHEALLDELRVILGNPVAMKAYRERKVPFPDGTVLAKVAWRRVPSAEDNGALGQFQAFVPGHATTVQFMVKDSRRYASTGGWG